MGEIGAKANRVVEDLQDLAGILTPREGCKDNSLESRSQLST